jgi:site-specific DNA recombinase
MKNEKLSAAANENQSQNSVSASKPSQGRTPNVDRGLPSEVALVDLAKTYLTVQHQLWPALKQAGTLPPAEDAILESMARGFQESFLQRVVTPYKPSDPNRTGNNLAASYLRYSDENSNPRSLDQQLRLQLEKAKRDNHFIPWSYVFADAAVTGRTAARHGYDLAKVALRLDDIKVLYIDELGRASRDALESLKLGKLVEHLGKQLLGVSDGFDSTGPHAKMQLSVYGMFNEMFSDQLRCKVNRGMKDAFDRGTNIHTVPVGYDLVPATDTHGNPIHGKDGDQLKTKTINPEEAEHVQWAFQAFGREGKSPSMIARRFNELSVAGSRKWDDGAIRQMLRRETYVGIEIYGRTYNKTDPETGRRKTLERPRGEWLVRRMRSAQIVSWSLWKAVKQRFEVTRAANGKNRKPEAMTKSEIYPTVLIRLICGSCGSNLRLGRSGKYASFYCPNANYGKMGCSQKGYKAARIIDEAILNAIRLQVFSATFVAQVLDSANQALTEASNQPSENTAVLEAKIFEVKRKSERLAQLVESDENKDIEVLVNKLRGYSQDLRTLRERLEQMKMRNQAPPPPLTTEDVEGLLNDLSGLLHQDVSVSAPILKKLTGPVVVDQVIGEGKAKSTWIARFTINAMPLLVELAASGNHPNRRTWEYLNKSSWMISESVEVGLEDDLRRYAHADSVAELISEGSSISEAAATLGISWQLAKEALNHARLTKDSAISGYLFSPRLASEEAAHRPIHAAEVWLLYEHESLSVPEIAKRLHFSQSTTRRAYDWVRDEKMVALKCGTSFPDYMRLPVDAQAKPLSVLKADALRDYVGIIPILREHRDAGLSLDSIAKRLNNEGHTTRRGKLWTSAQVGRVLKLHKD